MTALSLTTTLSPIRIASPLTVPLIVTVLPAANKMPFTVPSITTLSPEIKASSSIVWEAGMVSPLGNSAALTLPKIPNTISITRLSEITHFLFF